MLARIKDECPDLILCSTQTPPSDFEIEMVATPDGVRVGIGEVMSFTVPDVYEDADELFGYVVHALIALLSRLNATAQVQRLLSVLLRKKVICRSKPLALYIMDSIAAAPDVLVEFGLLNQLSDPTEPEYGMATVFIMGAVRTYGTSKAIEDWYAAAMSSARSSGCDTTLATVHYSRANGLVNAGRLKDAVHFYNQARECDPDYVGRKYYLMEFGGVLYHLRRFRMAAKLYELGIVMDPSATDMLRYGDALMFSGEIGRAKDAYDQAHARGGEDLVKFEAFLKRQICDALVAEYGDTCPRRMSQMEAVDFSQNELTPAAEARLMHHLKEVDALDAVSNFNLGLQRSKEGNFAEALLCFLIAAFQSHEDDEAWCNAMICAYNVGSEPLLMVMIVSRAFAGHAPYQRFRSQLLERDGSDKAETAIGLMDETFRQLEPPYEPSDVFFDYVKQVQSEMPDQTAGGSDAGDGEPDS